MSEHARDNFHMRQPLGSYRSATELRPRLSDASRRLGARLGRS